MLEHAIRIKVLPSPRRGASPDRAPAPLAPAPRASPRRSPSPLPADGFDDLSAGRLDVASGNEELARALGFGDDGSAGDQFAFDAAEPLPGYGGASTLSGASLADLETSAASRGGAAAEPHPLRRRAAAPTPDAFDGRGVVPRRRWGDAAAARAPSPGLLDERRPSSGAWSQAGSSEDMEIGRGDFTPRDGTSPRTSARTTLGDIGPPPSRSRSVSPLGAPPTGLVTDRARREALVDHLVEMAEPRDRLNRMRKWKLLYAIDGDIYFLLRKDPDLREMQMALSAYRIFRKDGDDGARPPLRVKVAIALEHRQAIAFTLNPEHALTTPQAPDAHPARPRHGPAHAHGRPVSGEDV
ncbi:hypothetical protein JL720_16380 [Aureococcus anophagefferens]|nr:hypothetical protein JL720_16380 [Aureococcus anophagefferens]